MEELSFTNSYNDTLYGHKWVINNPSKILLIVTGMAEHSGRYDDFATFLNKEGFIVYSLDHYGQGKNNNDMNPPSDYFFKMEDTIKEFVELLKEQFDLPILVLAHSMGSFILQGFLEKYSSYIDKAVIMGSNGRNPGVKIGKSFTKIYVNNKNKDKKATILHSLVLGNYEKTCKNEESKNAWISVNKENVKKYDEDPLSGVKPTNNFYKEFMKGLNSIQKTKNIKNINKELPILIIGGKLDPVGNYGKGLNSLYKLYKKHDLNVEILLYDNMKHEILNELDKDKVYKDILTFFDK